MDTTQVRQQAQTVWNGILDMVYPPHCLVCGVRSEDAFCKDCAGQVKPVVPPFCDRCGVPAPADSLVCQACETGPEPPFAWSQALGEYDGTLRRAIHRMKYEGKAALALPLGILLARSLDGPPTPLLRATNGDDMRFDLVVPVPLHPARLRQRGFNQAERIARVLARERNWKLDVNGLKRTRRTTTQTALSPVQRHANIAGAFACASPLRFHNQSVLIIDDVLTTMATSRECARVAREAGASRVGILALARGI